jgi:hypothetical protein
MLYIQHVRLQNSQWKKGSCLQSDEISGFIEQNGGMAHTKERCQQVKSKQEITLESVLRKLETHGIIINVARLMAQ